MSSLHPRKLCAKFGWWCQLGSGREDIQIWSIWISFPNVFFQVWLKLALGLYREKNPFKSCQDIIAISLLSPFGKLCDPSFEQTLILLTQGCFLHSLVENDQLVREKKICIAILLLSPLETGHGPSIKNFNFFGILFCKVSVTLVEFHSFN